MKHWIWRILLAAAAAAALTVCALAAEGSSGTPAAPKTPENKVTLDNGLVIRELTDNKWEVTGFAADYTGGRNPLTIPSSYGTVGANNITQIAAEAFKGAVKGKDIVMVIVPTSVNYIGKNAFEGCPKLETVVFLEHGTDSNNKLINPLTIDEKAFLGCTELSNVMFSRGVGTIKSQAFGANLKLEEVVIPDGVSAIEERAFAQCANLKTIYIPASLKPVEGAAKPIAATTFSGTGLVSIHYGGAAADRPDIQKIMDLPTGLDVWKDVHAAVNDRMITEPTCVNEGHVYGGVSCNAAAASKTNVCGSFVKIIDLPVLGHDYQQIPDSRAAYQRVLEEHEKAPCKEQRYDYVATCYRCGEEIQEVRTIPADPARHAWKEDGTDKKVDEKTKIPATCKGSGFESWTRTCPACGFVQTGTDRPELKDEDKDSDGHTRMLGNVTPDETIEPTCISPGVEVSRRTCDCGNIVDSCEKCAELLEAIEAVEDEPEAASEDGEGGEEETPAPEETALEKRAKAVQAYIDHLEAEHGGENSSVKFTKLDPAEHTWREEYIQTAGPTCTKKGVETKQKTCEVCGEEELVSGDTREVPALGHDWDEADPSYRVEMIKEANCTEDGQREITGKCKREDCDGTPNEEDGTLTVTETIPTGGHQWTDIGENDYVGPGDKAPTCTEPGRKTNGTRVCTVCREIEEARVETVAPLGHRWGSFAADPGQDAVQAENCRQKTVTGTVSCERDGCGETQERTITIPGKMGHNWGEWVTIKEPTGTKPGTQKRTCRICGETEERTVSAAGGTSSPGTSDPGTSDPGTTDPGTSKPDPNAVYTITVTSGAGGAAAASRTTAKAGNSVTITVSPSSGFELDMIRVTGSATAMDLTGSQRSFTMPASNVNVTVSFSPIDPGSGWGGASNGAAGDPTRSKDNTPVQITPQSIPRAGAWGQIFSDIPTGHWAAGEINWANGMGYMNGAEGRFNPDEPISCQQMWMVLARLTGSYPANMADARRWAVEGGFADGSSPTAPVARHQLVTALYRCAHLKGGVSRSNASLAGYADSRVVPAAARDAFAWAVANGIVSGTSGSRLEPNGTLTRAQFAVILYRYSQRV